MKEKDFDIWNKEKRRIDITKVLLEFKIRDMWFMKMGRNIGFEQDGKGDESLRPVVVIKKFNSHLFWGLPMTSKDKKGWYYHHMGEVNGRKNTAILSQLRLYDAKRLKYKIGACTGKDLKGIKEKIKNILENEEYGG